MKKRQSDLHIDYCNPQKKPKGLLTDLPVIRILVEFSKNVLNCRGKFAECSRTDVDPLTMDNLLTYNAYQI